MKEVRKLQRFLRDRRNLANSVSCLRAKELSKLLFDNLHPVTFKKVINMVSVKENFSSPGSWLMATEICKKALVETYYQQLRILFQAITQREFQEQFRTKIRNELVVGIPKNKTIDLLTETRFIAQEKFLKDTIKKWGY